MGSILDGILKKCPVGVNIASKEEGGDEMSDKPLRFCPLIRVSTEQQERMGESLRTQKTQIEQAIKTLHGTLIADPWRYSGQEHATQGFERKRFDQLLKDAQRGLFNAVMVCDPSRWSRDNVKSGQGLQVLRDHGIRFFVLQVEHDLFDPTAELFLGMTTQINQYVAGIQTQKSIRNRIARSARGVPAAGKLPYGRTFNKETEVWDIDKDKQKKIAWAAERYIKGDRLEKLAKMVGLHSATLWKILTRRCGDSWEVHFRSKKLALDEKVILKIPPLLPPETIRKIHERAEGNKRYGHGGIKNQYLLSRMVFCKACNRALFGQTNRSGVRYYREERGCEKALWCRSDELEEAVLVRLFATVGDAEGIEQAMLKAIPNRSKLNELRERKAFLESELSKVQSSKERLIKTVSKGLFSEKEVESEIGDIRERANLLASEIGSINALLTEGPTEDEIRGRAKMIQRIVNQIYRTPSRLAKMSFDERRKLVSTFFAGKDAQGRRLGVYLERDKKTGIVKYEIRGAFDQTFEGSVTPDGNDPQGFNGASIEHIEDLKVAVKPKGQNSKSSRSSIVQDRPYHDKQDCHRKDQRHEPQVEQWVAWGNIHFIGLTSFFNPILNLGSPPCQEKTEKTEREGKVLA